MHLLTALLPARKDRTLIRALGEADLSAFHAYRSDEDLAKYQGWSPMSLEEANKFIAEMTPINALRPAGWIQLAIADAQSDMLLGDVGLFLEADQSAAEIGFTLSKQAQGNGHASNAVHLSLSLIFAASSATSVRAVTDSRNLRSVKVLERTGFSLSSVQQALFKGEPCTELVYVRQRADA